MEHLGTALRKGSVRDLLAFFPPNKRTDKALDEHFRAVGLPQVSEWWVKRQYASLKEGVVSTIKELLGNDDSHDEVSYIECDRASPAYPCTDCQLYQDQAGGTATPRY